MKKILILMLLPLAFLVGCNTEKAPEAMDKMEKDKTESVERQDTASKKDEVMDKMESNKMMEKEVMKEDNMEKEVDDTMMKEMDEMTYDYSGNLIDVSGGSSTGVAMSTFANGNYSLKATFADLPEPEGTDFYEGWIVRKGLKFSVLSTGKTEKVDGVYSNMYSSGEDLTDHDFYVLTIEPDDGDPAPAKHILEGTMKKVQ